MPRPQCNPTHHAQHAFANFHGTTREGLAMCNRRNLVKASMAGIGGLSLPQLLQSRAEAARTGRKMPSGKSVILLWMTGGPSHIDMWDMKPERPPENRGPFSPITTNVPGIQICEHLPMQAAMMDQFTLIRSVDCRKSSHQPNQVMQTANRLSAPRTNPKGDLYPAIASIVAKEHGTNQDGMPPYVAFMKHESHVAWGGYLGKAYDPFIANNACELPVYDNVGNDTGKVSGGNIFQMPSGLSGPRIATRYDLLKSLDRMQTGLDLSGSMKGLDTFQRQAVDMLLGGNARQAFDLSEEPDAVRERYGDHLWCRQALLARRLVQRGAAFVTLDLSYHSASGTWDNHGDNVPPYGGIQRGLGPLLPLFDRLLTTLVSDLREHDLLDDVLVIAMGEFGRTPQIGTQGSSDGRNHWPKVMSMCMAGGGLRHGQVIGATEPDGGDILQRPVTPADLAATIYRYFGVPLNTTYEDDRGRPRFIVEEDGKPIDELF